MADCWLPEHRGQAVAIYSLAPILGPILGTWFIFTLPCVADLCIGPVVGSWIVEKAAWRWVFWTTSMTCGCVQIIGFLTLKESER